MKVKWAGQEVPRASSEKDRGEDKTRVKPTQSKTGTFKAALSVAKDRKFLEEAISELSGPA